MNFLKKLANGAVDAVKSNPQLALAFVGLFAPKVIAKAAPIIIAATTKPSEPLPK